SSASLTRAEDPVSRVEPAESEPARVARPAVEFVGPAAAFEPPVFGARKLVQGSGDTPLAAGKPSFSPAQAAQQLTRDNLSWNGQGVLGQAATVTVSFLSSSPSYAAGEGISPFSRFTVAQMTAAKAALSAWSDVAGITFVFTDAVNAYSNNGDIRFGNYRDLGDDAAAAFAYMPEGANPKLDQQSGDVWYNVGTDTATELANGQYGMLTLVHEIGHAIGLDHPGDYNGGNPTYANSALYLEDSNQFTVMSYFYEFETGADYGPLYPATTMLHDIAAAQRLYGANTTTRTGDTTYGFNANAGRSWFSAAGGQALIFAVWDAGGVDTFDFSGYSDVQYIDLREGWFSNVGGLKGNVAIARGVTIENAIGGSGVDDMFGNDAANILSGGAGADSLRGLGGDDTLTGGADADVFWVTIGGGADTVTDFTLGTDLLNISDFGAWVGKIQSGADTLLSFAGGVTVLLRNILASALTLTSIAGYVAPIEGSAGADTLNGTGNNDTIRGFDGDDILNGLGGDDLIEGGVGLDTIRGGGEKDNLFGEGGDDALMGEAGDDRLTGGAGDDTLTGGAGKDIFVVELNGGADRVTDFSLHDDRIDISAFGYWRTVTQSGGDTLFTFDGGVTLRLVGSTPSIVDWMFIGKTDSPSVVLDGTAAGETLNGDIWDDVLRGLGGDDTLNGLEGDDELEGGEGADTLNGGAGWDALLGGAGDDVLNAGTDNGQDDLTGGAGNDTYHMHLADRAIELAGEGIDTVYTDANGYTLDANIENGVATGFQQILYGNGLDNIMTSVGLGGGLQGGGGNDQLYGLEGYDSLAGGTGDDLIYGGADNDGLGGDEGDDVVYGEGGNDGVYGHDGADQLYGGDGDDVMVGGLGRDQMRGGQGKDSLTGDTDLDQLWGDEGDDDLNGGGSADTLTGGAGADRFVFEAGTSTDTITDFELGVDQIDVTAYGTYQSITQVGADTVVAIAAGVTAKLLNVQAHLLTANNFRGLVGTPPPAPPPPSPPPPPPPPTGGVVPGDQATLVGTIGANTINGTAIWDTIQGLDGNDTLNGLGGSDRLEGGAGADKLFGGDGDDVLIGGAGQDTLTGGAGADIFVLATGDGANTIADFQVGVDKVDVSAFGAVTSKVQMA
ncbi:MAG: Serralysin, partial [Caulobacter sp.]|nr:Serralysin [Caulobacter sp.]